MGWVPAAEIAHDGYTLGIGGPHSKGHAAYGPHLCVIRAQISTKDIPEALVAAFADKVQIQRADGGKEVISISHGADRGLGVGDF